MNRLALGALLLVGAALSAACDEHSARNGILASTAATPQLTQSYAMPVHVTATASASGCDNSPGPYITLNGQLALGGLGSRFTFTNNQKGTHTYSEDHKVDVTVVPAGDAITIPKQPVQGGVGGNPFIWVQLVDGADAPLTSEIYLGRCVQGLDGFAADFDLSSVATALVVADSCSNSPGPYITLGGELALKPGVKAKLIFRNNDNPVGGPHEADSTAAVSIEIVPPGQVIQFQKQPVLGGVGGNPWIYFQFLSGTGAKIGQEVLLGRCVQLNQA